MLAHLLSHRITPGMAPETCHFAGHHSTQFAAAAVQLLQQEGHSVFLTDLQAAGESDAESSDPDQPIDPASRLNSRKEAKALEREIPWRQILKMSPEDPGLHRVGQEGGAGMDELGLWIASHPPQASAEKQSLLSKQKQDSWSAHCKGKSCGTRPPAPRSSSDLQGQPHSNAHLRVPPTLHLHCRCQQAHGARADGWIFWMRSPSNLPRSRPDCTRCSRTYTGSPRRPVPGSRKWCAG